MIKTLPKFYQDLAKKEVGENADHVKAHLISFKRWLDSSPHLKLPMKDEFLLSFLRYAHYDHSLAQRRVDNFCTLRCSDPNTSCWFDYPELNNPVLEKYLDTGIFVPLGFTEGGLFVVLIRLASWNPQELDQVIMRTLNNMNFERLLFDQRCQIGGFCFVIDMNHTSLEQAKQWADLKEAKGALKLMQDGSPGRTKHLVFYKESKFFDFAFKLCEVWMSKKMRERILRVKDDMNKAFKKIPGLKDVMPVEYNGKNGPLNEAIERCKREVIEFYSQGFPLKDVTVDESKRPISAKNLFNEYKDINPALIGSSGTYVQLDVA